MVKLESKDLLLARVWRSIGLILFILACYELVIYGHVDELVLLSFNCSGFALILFCRCALSLSPFRRKPFLRLASLRQGAVLDRRVFSLLQNIFIFYLSLKTL
jgi:hypothetical protein